MCGKKSATSGGKINSPDQDGRGTKFLRRSKTVTAAPLFCACVHIWRK
nr:MAG TPA: hypothetical protein [Caudoviricetes sp.]